jgi:N-acetylmuramoyl-L-alanine amidase
LPLALLALVCLVAPAAQAQSAARSAANKRRLADAYYQQALEARKAFDEISPEDRAARDYQKVIQAFRRVYWTTPGYANNTQSLLAVGELYEEMGRRLENARSFRSAIEAYEFLVREYPRSQFRATARLAIARIYREGLKQPEEALKRFEQFAADFPRHSQAETIRADIAKLRDEIAARTKQPEEPPAAASSEPAAPLPAAAPRDAPALVSGVRHWVTPDYTRVVIDVERDVKYEVGRVGNPPRVYIDLFDSRPASDVTSKTVPVENTLLTGVRTGRHKADVTRVVLYVADRTEHSVFELPNPYRVIVDIHDRPAVAAAPKATAPAPKQAERPGPPVPEAKEPRPEVASAAIGKADGTQGTEPAIVAKAAAKAGDGPVIEKVTAARPNRDGTRSLTRALGLKIGRILLDPGHGGSDVGTIGPTGYQEKELVLDVAKRLGQLIEERLGSEVLYTRQDDSFVPLETRTVLANEKAADLFLSIHVNSSRSPSARGAETYYLNFTADPAALEVAARENAVSQERISQLQGLVQKIALAEKVDESKEFAAHIQSSVWRTQAIRNRRTADRGVKKAPFVVLIGANMPSVLSEIAFLSNPQEEKLLKTPEHRQKIAEALYSGIVNYVETLSVVKVAGRQSESIPAAK